jgi:hypothetical protein
MEFDYILKRSVGTVGRPPVACAVCNFSPSGHVLTAVLSTEPLPERNKGLCNVHARELIDNQAVSEAQLEQMRQEWLASR